MSIEDICKEDDLWRAYAMSKCRDKSIADDIVQNMYINIMKVDKEIEKGYVLKTISNLICNHYKKKTFKTIDYEIEVKDEDSIYEYDDEELKVIENFNNEKWYRQILISESYDKSIREMADEYNINYGFVFREIKEGRNNILNG